MNQTIKTQWLQALRSDEYEQGIELLRSTEQRFCCLGVLCDIVAPMEWDLFGSHRGNEIFPSNDTIIEAEFTQQEVDILWELSGDNDGGDSFATIANRIETEL